MTLSRALLVVLAVACLPWGTAHAEPVPWANDPAYKSLVKSELKQLHRLLSEALKEDYRRQAVFLARRIQELNPDDQKVAGVLAQWKPEDLNTGTPKDKFVQKMTSTFKKLGDDYFHFGEKLERDRIDPVVYYPINIRAHRYGSQAGPLVTSMREAGELWMGTFSHHPIADVKKVVGSSLYEMSFPMEWDDEYLRANVHWPECKVLRIRDWRVITDCPMKQVLQLVKALDELDTYVLERMGGKRPRKAEPVSLLVFAKGETYDRLVPILVPERSRDRASANSSYYSRWRRRGLACWQHKEHKFVEGVGLTLGVAMRALARTHLAGKSGGSVRGRGAWFFDGLAGAFEGLDLSDPGFVEVNPKLSWRAAVARALQEQTQLLPWDSFLDLDLAKARDLKRQSLRVHFNGKTREVKDADVAAAQATAFVLGLLLADAKRAPKRVGKVIGDLVKRDRLADVDKLMGWKKGRAIQEADRLLGTLEAPK